MNARRLAGGIVAITALSAGCQSEDLCAESGTPCGGDVVGVWDIVNSCRDPSYAPPLPLTYLSQPVGTAREPPTELTSGPWCSYLEFQPGRPAGQKVVNFIFPYDTLGVAGGTFTYESDGTFRGLMSTSLCPAPPSMSDAAPTPGCVASMELSASCMTQFGGHPSCSELQAELIQYAASQPSFRDIECADGADHGCRCNYTVSFEGAYGGAWRTSGSRLTHSDNSHRLPSQVDYCVSGDTMTMWGSNRTSILDRPAGIRMLTFKKRP
jgi:hypothetical protein